MPYRNGTYVAFHAAGTSDPTASDMKYYRLLNAWNVRPDRDFHFIDSHNKAAAVRDTSSKERLKVVLSQRLRNSKNMILILGQTTRFDRDWIPFEIAYAVDNCRIPIIAAYPGFDRIQNPVALASTWPSALASRIRSGAARAIHVPFRKSPLSAAVSQFTHSALPDGPLAYYSSQAYVNFDIPVP